MTNETRGLDVVAAELHVALLQQFGPTCDPGVHYSKDLVVFGFRVDGTDYSLSLNVTP